MKKLYGVIGSPIEHSMSPLIHNDAFQHQGIDAYYHAFHVHTGELEAAINGMKALGVAGFNVTIPHKESIIPFLDEVDETARKIGAVNTVVNKTGKFIGYNTDGKGYVKALKKEAELENKLILIIGAGGAARAIFYSLAQESTAKIQLSNRTFSKAEDLVEEFKFEDRAEAVHLEQAVQRIDKYDVIVQTTSVGMYPNIEESPIVIESLKKSAVVSDIIYNPFESKLLKDAKAQGAIVQNGIQMFVHQASIAFELWTGIYPDTNRMTKLVTEQLGGRTC
jgi:shikimate dehydrogenase